MENIKTKEDLFNFLKQQSEEMALLREAISSNEKDEGKKEEDEGEKEEEDEGKKEEEEEEEFDEIHQMLSGD